MKFSFAVRKLGAADLGRARGHNCRTHPTASQIADRSAWFGKTAHVALSAWNQDRADLARSLAKRKDAVVGIEFVVQVGNQLDWREEPTPECPAGKPRKPAPASLKKLAEAVQRWTDKEFGADNVVSIEVHLDESTPHIQCVVTPIHGDKLQAKHWLNGPAATAALRRRAHQFVNRVIPCTYDPGRDNGGKPHDPGKRAGVAPVPEAPGLLDKLTNAPDRRRLAELEAENAELRARAERAEQVARSRAKAVARAQKEAAEAREEAKAARKSKERVELAEAIADAACARVKALEGPAATAALFTPEEVKAAQERKRQQDAEKARQAEIARQKAAEAAKRAEIEKEAQSRVAGIQKLLQRGGAAHTFAVKACEALRKADNDAAKVDWRAVEAITARESMGKHGQSAESVIEAITRHSPGRADPASHQEVRDAVNRAAPQLEAQYRQERAERDSGARLGR